VIDKLVQLGGFDLTCSKRTPSATPRSGQAVRRLVRLILIGAAAKVAKKRLPHAQQAYKKAVAAGARPIEAVGTAVAAFVGLAPGGSANSQ
jgi:hypothetical protein